jgi:hypothetical protein
MEVYGSDHILVGVVDHMQGDGMIKLNVENVDHVDTHVHLSRPADEIMAAWDTGDLELDDEKEMTEIEDNEEKEQEDWIERRR